MIKNQLPKIKLTDTEREILRLLEEAGAEDLGCIFNSLILAKGFSWDYVQEVETAIEHLLGLEMISLYKDEREPERRYLEFSESEMKEALPLSKFLQWNEQGKLLVRKEKAAETEPTGLMLTTKGREALAR